MISFETELLRNALANLVESMLVGKIFHRHLNRLKYIAPLQNCTAKRPTPRCMTQIFWAFLREILILL